MIPSIFPHTTPQAFNKPEVVYTDRLGKISIKIFPDACSTDDLNKAINFLLRLKAEKEST